MTPIFDRQELIFYGLPFTVGERRSLVSLSFPHHFLTPIPIFDYVHQGFNTCGLFPFIKGKVGFLSNHLDFRFFERFLGAVTCVLRGELNFGRPIVDSYVNAAKGYLVAKELRDDMLGFFVRGLGGGCNYK